MPIQLTYDKIYSLLIFRNNETGHVINVIKANGVYYFVDLFLYLEGYREYVCKETGSLVDFRKQKYITSVVYEANSIEAFISFYDRVMRRQVEEHIFVLLECDTIPPIGSAKSLKDVTVFIPRETVLKTWTTGQNIHWCGERRPLVYPQWKVRS